MAQSLRSDMSVKKNHIFGKRHVSLCDQFPGAEVLVEMIDPYINDVEKRLLIINAQRRNRSRQMIN